MKKERNLVLLPTDKESGIGGLYKKIARVSSNPSYQEEEIGELSINQNIHVTKTNDYWEAQHLYITDDSPIKEGDWFLDKITNDIHKATYASGISVRVGDSHFVARNCKKIIITTDESLATNISRRLGVTRILPQPSLDFIKRFVEEYNKGNVIDKVLVEYQELKEVASGKMIYDYLKLNPDNTIIISLPEEEMYKTWVEEPRKRIAEGNPIEGDFFRQGDIILRFDGDKWVRSDEERMYSKEEVENIILKHQHYINNSSYVGGYMSDEEVIEWIKENLK